MIIEISQKGTHKIVSLVIDIMKSIYR